MTTLTDQTVLITGANRGLGREFVEQFLTRWVAKVYAAGRNPESITTHDPRVVPPQPTSPIPTPLPASPRPPTTSASWLTTPGSPRPRRC